MRSFCRSLAKFANRTVDGCFDCLHLGNAVPHHRVPLQAHMARPVLCSSVPMSARHDPGRRRRSVAYPQHVHGVLAPQCLSALLLSSLPCVDGIRVPRPASLHRPGACLREGYVWSRSSDPCQLRHCLQCLMKRGASLACFFCCFATLLFLHREQRLLPAFPSEADEAWFAPVITSCRCHPAI